MALAFQPKFFKLLAGMLVAVLALGLLGGCSSGRGQHVLLDKLGDMEEAVEDKNVSRLMGFLAEDFSGPSGMDRARAEAFARVMMARHSDIGVAWDLKNMDVNGDRATVEVGVILTGKALVPGFDARGRLMNVQMGWRVTDGEWMLVNARWTSSFDKNP